MDVSTLFRASVKTVSLRNAALENNNYPKPEFKKLRTESGVRRKSQGLVQQITKLKEFLLENRPAYLNITSHLSSENRMTDAERDEIDNGAQEIIATCLQMIKDLKREVANLDVTQQNQEHLDTMLLLTTEYMKSVCKIYWEQKTTRARKITELRSMAKLELNKPKPDVNENLSNKSTLNVANEFHDKKNNNSNNNNNSNSSNNSQSSNSSPLKVQEMNGDVNAISYEEELSTEDIQMFEAENEQLYNELNTITEEVKQIESKVVYIAELQEIFTEKILTQDRDLDKLVTTVVGSTENVKEANEQIRQAIQRNAGLRVWILFFLLVMSFSLLFLDWYNP